MTRFSVWSPSARKVAVALPERREELAPVGDGWWAADIPDATHGTDYGFVLDERAEVLPDPRSLWQPRGVHAPSRVYDHARFPWTDDRWHGRPLPGSVLYELHIGTFTPEGTLDAAATRLDHLADLGVDAVELMPLAAFSGHHGWGYDGVCLWAVHEPYGGPDALKRFVDTAHARGIAVVLDVVYNHLGPSGNRLRDFGPYFTDAYATPWGDAINFDQAGADGVRAFVVENALMWLRDFRLDGLRLDAVHAIRDQQAVHILEELSAAVDALAAHLGRAPYLIAESDLNDPRLITPREAGGLGLTAQWDDDVHHALHALLTGERQGYYADFGTPQTLAKALTSAFVHDGGYSTFRGRHHGRPVDRTRTPAHRFIASLQNHDQIGNRATGTRLSTPPPPPSTSTPVTSVPVTSTPVTDAPGASTPSTSVPSTDAPGAVVPEPGAAAAAVPGEGGVDMPAGEGAGAETGGVGLSMERLKIGAALLLLGPFTPMLFMGEEWGAKTPWCYFTDHREPDLGRAVTEGRRREFARHGWRGEIPDPQAVDTFRRSVLDWTEPDESRHRDLLRWYRALIALRRACPEFTDPDLARVAVEAGDTWLIMRRGRFRVAANLDDHDTLDLGEGTLVLSSATAPPETISGEKVSDESISSEKASERSEIILRGTGVVVVSDGDVRRPG
ncbi:malto-oligosyltrehalose trehalohydrolase [Actinomadura rupiterrae]|uniref:malto-oligosyltrehalose trehalohydrolase n=1 Tax=Actinomadura rupiterrae TaxID=559627 RepID=UPI0020A50B6C|nr:malto-oligosyltrehalose trehalohydrolase [Actinomadura rupiterrae]MCP2335396.1 malto-oligosyltrehalose trehalohydrolase [Actinomadura rupiterrae]